MRQPFKNTLLLFALLFPISAFAANPAVLFVFDGSGSMWGQVDGKTKIELAKEAMSGLVRDFPAGTDIGLISYGHRKEGDCSDIETLASLGSSKDSVISAVQSINPKGKTPLTKSIQIAAEQLKNRDAPTSIVVISDGKESCNADPCEAVKAVRKAGVNVKVHVIGFDVKGDEAKQLQCIASNGGGKYFAANNAGELAKGFAEVKKEVVEVAKPAPTSKVVFRDDFDDEFLSDKWEILNPDEDSMIVENGFMTSIVTQSNPKKASNTLRLKMPIPKGDWMITANFNMVPQSMAEAFELGVTNEDASKQILSKINIGTGNYVTSGMYLSNIKVSKKGANFYKNLFSSSNRDLKQRSDYFRQHIKSITIRLQKEGRKYIASAKLESVQDKDKAVPQGWVVLQALTSLRLPGKTFFIKMYSNDTAGYLPKNLEGAINLNWVEVRSMQ